MQSKIYHLIIPIFQLIKEAKFWAEWISKRITIRARATPKMVTEEAMYLTFWLISMYRDQVTEDSSLAYFDDKIPKLLTYLLEPLKRQLMKLFDDERIKFYQHFITF